MNKDLTLVIDIPAIFLQVTYNCNITRGKQDSDHAGTWWEPDVDSQPIGVFMQNHKEEEFEWFYGDNKPGPIVRAIEMYGPDLDRLLYQRAREIVNNPNFEDPHEH